MESEAELKIKRLSCPTLVRKFTTHSHLDRVVLGVCKGTLDSNILGSLPNLDRLVLGVCKGTLDSNINILDHVYHLVYHPVLGDFADISLITSKPGSSCSWRLQGYLNS